MENGLINNSITDLFEDREGNLWIGSGSGLQELGDVRFVNDGRPEGLASDEVDSVFEDARGRIWIGNENGLGMLPSGEDRVVNYPLPPSPRRPGSSRGLTRNDAEDAREEAERANAAKTLFLSRMSHELRTPLNAILRFGQLLEMEALSEIQTGSVEQILRGGRHLLSLVNEVLDISSVVNGAAVSVEEVDLPSLVEEVVALIEPLARDRRVSVHIEPTFRTIHLEVDRQRLK